MPGTRITFNDPELQFSFTENGYVIIPFLDEKETARLRDFYFANNSDLNPEGLHSSMTSGDVQLTKLMFETIVDSLMDRANDILQDYKPVLAQYLVKEPKTDFTFQLHTDTSMVDEGKYNSVNIWCALDNVNADSGAMFVWQGGHTHIDFARAAGPPVYIPENLVKEIRKQGNLKTIELKEGEAIIMNNRLAHGSMPNNTSEHRIAANLRLIPKEAENLFYYKEPNGDFSVYKVPEDYYKIGYTEGPNSRPEANSLVRKIGRDSILSGINKLQLLDRV